MGRSSICHFVVCLLFAAGALSAAAGEQANPAPEEPAKAEPAAQGFTWFDNYGLAMKHAEQQKQLLLVVFTDANRQLRPNLDELFGSADLKPLLADVTAVKLPVDARVQVGGKPLRLLGHHAFSELQGQAGLAIIDLRDADSRYFRQVVSIFPFHAGRTLDSFQLRTLLTLPSGSLTQRTLVFAVRTHPERPQSALASWHPVLAAEAEGATLETVECIAEHGHLHPLQQCFLEGAALQCGICTPGFLVTAKALLDKNPNPTEQEIRFNLANNLCRCTGYDKIVRAVQAAAEQLQQKETVS